MTNPRLLLGAVLALVACDPELELEPEPPPDSLIAARIHYALASDWEEAELVDGARVFTTDLGYTVGLTSWWQSTTNLELVACPEDEEFRHAGHTHDVSQLVLQVIENLVDGQTTLVGEAEGGELPYCNLYQIMGTVPLDGVEITSRVAGWYRAPGAAEAVSFDAVNTVPVSVLPEFTIGAWDETLDVDEARVELVRYPARAFDGLMLETLSDLDLAFSASQALGWDAEVHWALAR
ncbi:hypothetical protein ENSA5_67610 [Enhygromyxa salina]|uniref:Lipoprotein n=1 Tax=Enhygromyxa salina TaxID=215803 RepID=A0A2S9XBB3_9BACT|nr:hypothetical protein [Enhygromyxa salina]PRP90143.1 hypothetical protein ENSA5_67610 [Enhygromyxa salina]